MRDNPQEKYPNQDVFEVAKGKHCLGEASSDGMADRRLRAPATALHSSRVCRVCIKNGFLYTTYQSYCVGGREQKCQL